LNNNRKRKKKFQITSSDIRTFLEIKEILTILHDHGKKTVLLRGYIWIEKGENLRLGKKYYEKEKELCAGRSNS